MCEKNIENLKINKLLEEYLLNYDIDKLNCLVAASNIQLELENAFKKLEFEDLLLDKLIELCIKEINDLNYISTINSPKLKLKFIEDVTSLNIILEELNKR